MSEELSVGVRILLERCKNSPEEVTGAKWMGVVEAVFNYKETKARSHYLRGLTEHEIDLMFEALNGLYRNKFDSYIMANVLNTDEEHEENMMRRAQTLRVSPAHNNINTLLQPGGIYQTVAAQTSNTPVTVPDRIKKFIGL